MSTGMFLTDDEISYLTGRKFKGAQIATLKRMGIAFFVNARGHAVVTRRAIEGGPQKNEQAARNWSPSVLGAR